MAISVEVGCQACEHEYASDAEAVVPAVTIGEKAAKDWAEGERRGSQVIEGGVWGVYREGEVGSGDSARPEYLSE